MRILLVKTSSMGDVIQALPVIDDIHRAYPQARIDWLVEEPYADLVRMHRGVERVIPVALRRWRKHLVAAQTWREWRRMREALREVSYDAVIDAQGLFKSALLARMALGPKFGWRGAACREPWAAMFYDRTLAGPRYDAQSAVVRYRALAGWALHYEPAGAPHYSLEPQPVRPAGLPTEGGYAVILTATARVEKLWDEARWIETVGALTRRGLHCLFAWGTAAERARAQRLAQTNALANGAAGQLVLAPSALGLADWAAVLAGASVVVGVDTGLSFLAAAVGTPVVGIYVATSPHHVGIQSAGPHCNLGDIGQAPSAQEVIAAALGMARGPNAGLALAPD